MTKLTTNGSEGSSNNQLGLIFILVGLAAMLLAIAAFSWKSTQHIGGYYGGAERRPGLSRAVQANLRRHAPPGTDWQTAPTQVAGRQP